MLLQGGDSNIINIFHSNCQTNDHDVEKTHFIIVNSELYIFEIMSIIIFCGLLISSHLVIGYHVGFSCFSLTEVLL